MRTGPIVVSAQRDDGTTSGASGSRPAASPIQDRLDIVRAIERSCSRLQIAINTVFRSLCIMKLYCMYYEKSKNIRTKQN